MRPGDRIRFTVRTAEDFERAGELVPPSVWPVIVPLEGAQLTGVVEEFGPYGVLGVRVPDTEWTSGNWIGLWSLKDIVLLEADAAGHKQ